MPKNLKNTSLSIVMVASMACMGIGEAAVQPSTAPKAATASKKSKKPRKARKAAEKTAAPAAITPEPAATHCSLALSEVSRIDPAYQGMSLSMLLDDIEQSRTEDGLPDASDSNTSHHKSDLHCFVRPIVKIERYSHGISYLYEPGSDAIDVFILPRRSTFFDINGIQQRAGQLIQHDNIPREDGLYDLLDFDTVTTSKNVYEADGQTSSAMSTVAIFSTRSGIATTPMPFLGFARQSYYFLREPLPTDPTPAAQLKMDNIKAAAEIGALRVLVLTRPAAPYIHYHWNQSTPTADSPNETTVYSRYLVSDTLGFIVYSGLTGEVFAHIPSPPAGSAPVTSAGDQPP